MVCEVCGAEPAKKHSRNVIGYIGVLCSSCAKKPLWELIKEQDRRKKE